MNRVVITGYGAIDALGKNSKEVEKKLFDGQCGLGKKGFGTTENTVEGTIIELEDGKITVDEKETKQVAERIKKKMDDLWNN